jgi:phage terminase small subunit
MTPKQQAFVREYLVDLNATAAYMRAYPKAKSTSARALASQLLANPNIAEAVAQAMKERAKRVDIEADRVLKELARIAFFDPRRILHEDGRPKQLHELDDDAAAAIAGLEVLEEFEGTGADRVQIGVVKKYKIADKVAALTNAMRHLGMFNDKLTLNGRVTAIVKDFTGRKKDGNAGR